MMIVGRVALGVVGFFIGRVLAVANLTSLNRVPESPSATLRSDYDGEGLHPRNDVLGYSAERDYAL
jgi:hypothetical protein